MPAALSTNILSSYQPEANHFVSGGAVGDFIQPSYNPGRSAVNGILCIDHVPRPFEIHNSSMMTFQADLVPGSDDFKSRAGKMSAVRD